MAIQIVPDNPISSSCVFVQSHIAVTQCENLPKNLFSDVAKYQIWRLRNLDLEKFPRNLSATSRNKKDSQREKEKWNAKNRH